MKQYNISDVRSGISDIEKASGDALRDHNETADLWKVVYKINQDAHQLLHDLDRYTVSND